MWSLWSQSRLEEQQVQSPTLTQLTSRQLNMYSFSHIVSKKRTSSAQHKVTGPSHRAVLDSICNCFTYLVKIRHFFYSVSEFIVTVFFLPCKSPAKSLNLVIIESKWSTLITFEGRWSQWSLDAVVTFDLCHRDRWCPLSKESRNISHHQCVGGCAASFSRVTVANMSQFIAASSSLYIHQPVDEDH